MMRRTITLTAGGLLLAALLVPVFRPRRKARRLLLNSGYRRSIR